MSDEHERWPSLGIVDAAYVLPGEPVDLRVWGSVQGVAADRLAQLERNHCRYFHQARGQSDSDLIVEAVRSLQERVHFEPSKVAYLVHAHTQAFSAPAAPHSLLGEVSARLDLRPQLALSVGQLACAAVIQAVELGLDLLRADDVAQFALVVTADRVFGGATHRLRQDAGIQSDGASAILLGREGIRARVRSIGLSGHAGMHGGPAAPAKLGLAASFAWLHTRRLMEDICRRSGVAPADLAGIFPNNADAPYWVKLAEQWGADRSQLFLDNVRLRGHACCADIAINLVDEGFARLEQGREILAVSQSNVGAYGGMLLSKGDLP